MSDVRRWSTVLVHRWTSPGPQLDWAVVAALVVADVVAQALASADVDVSSAELAVGPVVLAAVSAGILFWRRTRPLAVLGGVLALYAIAAETIEPGLFTQLSGAATVLALYAVASWSVRRRWAVAIPLVLLALVVSGSLDDGNGVAESVAVAMAVVALPWVLGYAARTRRLYLIEVERRLADAERERDVRARQAVLAERAHIARELHDVVAHHVSLIGVQAGAARTALGHDPATTSAALEAIEASSRNAIGEMRHMLDALRDDDDATPLTPQPRLADVDAARRGPPRGRDRRTRSSPRACRPTAATPRTVLLPHHRGGADERDQALDGNDGDRRHRSARARHPDRHRGPGTSSPDPPER